MPPSPRILVTGAGGFLGRALCAQLLESGAQVLGTERERPVIPGVQPHPLPLQPDTGPALSALIARAGADQVFHLGAPVDPDRDPDRFPEMQAGVLATTDAVARACLAHDIPLVHVSTCEVYGDGPAPFREDQPLAPVSAYSAAKAAADLWVHNLARNKGLRAAIVRPFLAYGPGQRRRGLVPAAVEAAVAGRPFPMTAGTQTRELNHVDDLARGLALCAAPRAHGQVLNLCGGPELPVLAIVQRIFTLAGADPTLIQAGALPTRSGEVPRFCGDPAAVQALLGYQPQIPLDTGLLACIRAAQ